MLRLTPPLRQRTASASARVLLGSEAFAQVAENRLKKVKRRRIRESLRVRR
jgi:hypothetical protein